MSSVSEEISRILLKKLREEELDRQEAATLAEWESHSPENSAFIARLTDERVMSEKMKTVLRLDEQGAWNKIENELEAEWPARKFLSRRMNWIKYAAAACVIIALAASAFYFVNNKTGKQDKPPVTVVTNIGPGGSRGSLRMANGTEVDFSIPKNSGSAKLEGIESIEVVNGQLVYDPGKDGIQSGYNILTTPRGGECQLKLPDGTRIWLNAASAVRFPVAFAANERRVEIMGEVYFEVGNNPTSKFIVVIKSADGDPRGEIEAVGTRFNINAYENITATLVEGKVNVTAYASAGSQDRTSKQLIPGQQAQLTRDNKITVADKVDISQFVSWKDGVESFKGADIRKVMQYISRWYDVEVMYADGVPARGYNGDLDRSYTLAETLDILRVAKFNFSVEGRKVTVLP